jgi:hypothetical protein
MFNFKLIALPVLIILFSFLEILVFNEEILLTLCFLAFVFYAYSFIGQSIQQTFDDIGQKIEVNFIQSILDNTVILLTALFVHIGLLRRWSNCLEQISAWSTCITKIYHSFGLALPLTIVTVTNEVLTKMLYLESSTVNGIRYANTMQLFYAVLPFNLTKPITVSTSLLLNDYMNPLTISKSTICLSLFLK